MTSSREASDQRFRELLSGLRLPLLVAPMFGVSDLAVVEAARRAGVVGCFPTANCRSVEELAEWLAALGSTEHESSGAVCPNIIVRRPVKRLSAELELLAAHPPEMVVTSVGSPAPVLEALHGTRTIVLSDVATLHHAVRAIEAGADGLVLLCGGAGGQTGWLNPFAFCRAVRRIFDGPVVIAGGIADGHSIRAALELGADAVYCGTRFLVTAESPIADDYQDMVLDSDADDVEATTDITGLPVNVLKAWLARARPAATSGLEPIAGDQFIETISGAGGSGWPTPIFSAGHGVTLVREPQTIEAVVSQLEGEYRRGPEVRNERY